MAQALVPPTFSERLLGVKGSSLAPVKGSKASRKEREKDSAGGENPVARLKLLLIASFTTLHILNLITPLAPNYGHGHGHGYSHATSETLSMMTTSGIQEGGPVGVRRVDIMERGVKSALDALSLAVGGDALPDDDEDEDDIDVKKQLLVKVSPPIWIRVVPSSELIGSASTHSHAPVHYPTTPFERFMSSWTRLVGDPVFSKWIVVALAISISLNGYLLKGIAAGLGLGLGLVRKEGDGVRFSDGDGDEVGEDVKVKVVEKDGGKVKSGRQGAAVPTFTLEDVDRRLELKANSVAGIKKRRGTVGPAQSPAPVSSPVVPSRAFHLPTPPAPTPAHAPALLSVIVPSFTSPPPDADAEDADSEDTEHDSDDVHVRSLKECIEIYENGPRPASVALDMLTDEEVIMLAQHGKIAAYALEKVLGGERLERAVRVRRALVCEFLCFPFFFVGY
jgi:hydroxymethylglutaryl-CoA reductase (NADPH)